jgi:hypothetical protein
MTLLIEGNTYYRFYRPFVYKHPLHMLRECYVNVTTLYHVYQNSIGG